jgi:hypothetical protein
VSSGHDYLASVVGDTFVIENKAPPRTINSTQRLNTAIVPDIELLGASPIIK